MQLASTSQKLRKAGRIYLMPDHSLQRLPWRFQVQAKRTGRRKQCSAVRVAQVVLLYSGQGIDELLWGRHDVGN